MNLEFLVVALVIGRAVDWIFQTQWQAENKTHNFWTLFEHSMYYSMLTTWGIVFLTNISPGLGAGYIWITLLISHMIIDNRFLVKFIMYMKGVTWEQINSKEYGWLQLGIDQILHDLIILMIALII
jgi:hypothetical protein